MSFCPICGAHHDPNMPCADRAGEVLRDAGIEQPHPSPDKKELKETIVKANRILFVLLISVLGIFLLIIVFAPYMKSLRQDADSARAYIISGRELYKEGYYDRAIRDFSEAITSGKLSTEYLSIAYCNRGTAWYDKGDYDGAVADFGEAVRLNPKLTDCYYGRGLAWQVKGEYDKALADYNEVIQLDTNFTAAYENRGVILFNRGQFSSASADLAKARQLKPDIYIAIWLYLARERSKNDGREELATNSAYMDIKQWPAAVIELYLGKGDVDSVIAQASHDDPKKRREQMCEANFLIGEWHLLHNDRQQAAKLFKKARNDCPKNFYEYEASIAELERLQ